MSESIKERANAALAKIKEHDAKRKILEADLAYIRAICPHSEVETWKHYDYGGGCDLHWLCKECGLQKVT